MKDKAWWVIERYDEVMRSWDNIQGRYAYRADTSVVHTFTTAVAIFMAGYSFNNLTGHNDMAKTIRFRNKKTGRIISANDLLYVRITQT